MEGQTFENGKYAVIFRFRFWRNGEWVEVVVDDFLPVHEDNSLKFCRNNKDACEMFAPLLEKAYAKLNGCYEFLDGGDIVDALIEMTGGIHERIKLKSSDTTAAAEQLPANTLWEALFKAIEMKSLAGASTDSKEVKTLDNGLSMGHAYSVLDVFELIMSGEGKYDSLRKSYSDDTNKNDIKLIK